jgi:hypothetical protein
MRDEIEFDGVTYAAVRQASEEVALSRDYIARLCKKGSVVGRRVGTGWYVDMRSLKAFLQAQQHVREYRRQSLVRERSDEYRANRQDPLHGNLAATRDVSPVAVPSPAASPEIHERLRRALDEKSAVLSETPAIPSGLMSATLQSMPAQALAHIPASAITPTAEMVHKFVALAMTLLIVAGVFVLVAPSQTENTLGAFGTEAAALQSGFLASNVRSSLHSAQTFFSIESSALPNPLAFLSAGGANGHVALQVLPRGSSADISSSVPSAQGTSGSPAVAEAAAVASALSPQSASLVQNGTSANVASVATGLQQVASIATEVAFTGSNVSYGDLVAYDPATGRYTLTQGSNDPNAYGAVVQQPALLFKPTGNSDVPVLHSGSALVNVTLENGPIAVGDPLTSSSIPGKARRANAGEHVIGIAAEAFTGQSGVPLRAPDGTQVLSGTILSNMNTGASDASSASAPGTQCSSLACRLLSGIDPSLARSFARYLLSGLIAALALFLAFKSFMSDANYGVISMGRNPRASSSIQSMVLVNAFLAMAIASAGLFAAIVVLFATA